jgi:hypothetical protein
LAIFFAVLWAASMLWRAQTIHLNTVSLAVIAGAVVGLLMYWLYGQFSGRFR